MKTASRRRPGKRRGEGPRAVARTSAPTPPPTHRLPGLSVCLSVRLSSETAPGSARRPRILHAGGAAPLLAPVPCLQGRGTPGRLRGHQPVPRGSFSPSTQCPAPLLPAGCWGARGACPLLPNPGGLLEEGVARGDGASSRGRGSCHSCARPGSTGQESDGGWGRRQSTLLKGPEAPMWGLGGLWAPSTLGSQCEQQLGQTLRACRKGTDAGRQGQDPTIPSSQNNGSQPLNELE